MVAEVKPTLEEQIPLRPDPANVNIPFNRNLPAKVGYGDGDQNSFYSERQAYIWSEALDPRAREGYAVAADGLENAIDIMDRTLAEQELAVSSANVANKTRQQAINTAASSGAVPGAAAILMESLNVSDEIERAAKESPKNAASLATINLLNPSLPEATRATVAFRDMQLGTVAGRLDDRRLVSFGTSNWVADAGALLATPGRILFGQTQFPGAYYGRMKEWNTLSIAERQAQWPELEQDLWDAAGNNAIVYSSMVMPFINPDDDIWAKVDSGLDVVDTLGVVFSVARLASAPQKLQKLGRLRSTALAAGNKKAAGADAARAIAKGEQTAIVEGHPVGVSDADTTIPEVQAGLEVPTTSHLVNDLVDRGIVPDEPTDIPVENVPMLNDTEKAAAIERARLQIGTNGKVLSVEQDSAGFSIDIEQPTVEAVPVADARKLFTTLEEDLTTARQSLKEAVEAKAGTEALATLNNQIKGIKARQAQVRASIEHAATLEGTGLKVASVKVPGAPGSTTVNFKWTVDHAGMLDFKEGQIGTVATLLGSQEFRADNVVESLTGLGSFISNQQRRLYGHVSKQVKSIEKNLKSGPVRRLTKTDEKQRVGAVLLKGDKEQTTFSEMQLMQGIETPELGLVRLNDREVAGYQAMRQVFDDLWRMLNRVQRDDLTSAGFSAFRANHVSKDGTVRPVTLFAKARHEDIGAAIPRVGGSDITHAVDVRTGNIVDLRSVVDLQKNLDAGRMGFIRLKEDFIAGDGQHFRHALVDVTKVGELRQAKNVTEIPAKVLDFRRGYVPKIAADRVGFVVETVGDVVRNGIRVRDVEAYRGFKTRAEADIWINRKVAAGAEGREFRIQALDGGQYRRSNPEGSDFVQRNLFLGAFGGYRTDGVFRIGLEGYEGGRMSAFEAVRRYADYVGRHAPMHQFKQGMIKRFMNSVKNTDGSRALETSYDWTSPLQLSKSDPRYRSAKAIQDWMKAVFAIPTNEERWFQGVTQTLGYALDRAIWNKATGEKRFGAGFYEFAQNKLLTSPWAADPFQQFKSLTFDMMLGMFNPAQLVVQSAGMAVPISLHPVEAAAVMPKFLALRNLFKMRDAESAARIASSMGLKADEFKAMWQGYQRSGFPDSILENADYGHYIASAHGYYSPGFLKTVREKGRFFYNMGELNTRTFAWTMAYERLRKANGWNATKELTSQQLLEVNNEALRLSMNMMAANRANWQQGILALPTQFMQVTAKYYENLLGGLFNLNKGGKWSRSEAASSAFISTLAFGMANWSVDELSDDFESWLVDKGEFGMGLDPDKDADTIAMARGGLAEMLSLEALGFGLDISDRISLGSGINMAYDNIVVPISAWLFEGDASQMASALIGASGTVGTRIHTAAASFWNLFRADVATGELDSATVAGVAMDLARVTSTGTNAIKAYTWNALNEIINDRTGEPFGMAPPDENPGVIYAKAIGFDPLALEKYYIVERKTREHEQQVRDISMAVAAMYRQLYHDGDVHDPAVRDRLRRNAAVLLRQLSPADRADVMKQMQEIWSKDNKIDNLQKRLFDQLMNADGGGSKEAADIAILENLQRSNARAE